MRRQQPRSETDGGRINKCRQVETQHKRCIDEGRAGLDNLRSTLSLATFRLRTYTHVSGASVCRRLMRSPRLNVHMSTYFLDTSSECGLSPSIL